MATHDGYCAKFFSALSNKLRIRILQAISLKPLTVNEIVEKVGGERTLVSHNLALLVKADLAHFKKSGKTRIYTANMDIVPHVFLMVERLVCSKCSIRKVCEAYRERDIPAMTRVRRPPCEDCR